MQRPEPPKTIYRIALHAGNFFGSYNGVCFEKGCLEPIDFKSFADALTIAKIQCINVAAEKDYEGARIIAVDKFIFENGTTSILPVVWVHVEGDGLNPNVEEIS